VSVLCFSDILYVSLVSYHHWWPVLVTVCYRSIAAKCVASGWWSILPWPAQVRPHRTELCT